MLFKVPMIMDSLLKHFIFVGLCSTYAPYLRDFKATFITYLGYSSLHQIIDMVFLFISDDFLLKLKALSDDQKQI